jgi:DEAD/DEAH box helicase domain-containing protein
MGYELVFDIETENTFAEVGNDVKGLRVTCVCTYNTATGEYQSFTVDTLSQLWPLFEGADRLIGYNSDYFDLPVLNNYYSGDCTKFPSLDLLKVIKESLGRRIKLDDVARATLHTGKSADGLKAIEWWKAGEHQKVIDYCIQDVKVTHGVYEFGRKNKQLFFETLTGEVQPFPVNFDMPEVRSQAQGGQQNAQQGGKTSFNMSLPF